MTDSSCPAAAISAIAELLHHAYERPVWVCSMLPDGRVVLRDVITDQPSRSFPTIEEAAAWLDEENG